MSLSQFQHHILHAICPSSDQRNLIRFHDKNFTKTGDCSFPSLKNTNVWKDATINESEIEQVLKHLNCLKIKKILSTEKSVYIWLDRTFVINQYFDQYQDYVIVNKNEIDINTQVGDKDDLTSCRVNMFSQMLNQYLTRTSCSTNKFHLGLKNDKHKEVSTEDVIYIEVGAVLGQDGKKCQDTSQQFYRKIYGDVESQDEERRDECESESERQTRLHMLTQAQMTFMLTASTPAQQVKVDTCGRSAVFVLYNCARVIQILNTFQQNVQDGIYPSLPDKIDWRLLVEEEEWQLFFVYILPYTDVLQEAVKHKKLHKIVLHLIGLSNCLSRYYSRVKILREGMSGLTVPTLHTRIKFLQHVHNLIVDALSIMGLKPLDKI